MAIYTYLSENNPYDYGALIPLTRKRLFAHRNSSEWNSLKGDLLDYVSPLERRNFIFDQGLDILIDSQVNKGFSTDLDRALKDEVIDEAFHKGINILLEDYQYIKNEPETFLRDLKLERLIKQWEVYQLALLKNAETPPEFVLHSSLNT
eukprot:UN03249